MCVYVCMYVYMCVCMYVYMYVRTCVHACMCVCVHVYAFHDCRCGMESATDVFLLSTMLTMDRWYVVKQRVTVVERQSTR